MLDPVVKTVNVSCSQETAFNVFVDEMGRWWPLDKRAMSMQDGESAEELSVDPSEGGKIVEVSDTGTEHHWGTITSYDPPGSVTMDFHMGLPPESASVVEVQFTPLETEQTRVELTHRNWEAFGNMAEMMRENYESSWGLIFEEAYKSACPS